MAHRMNRFTILGSAAIGALALAGGSAVFALDSSPSSSASTTTSVLLHQAPSASTTEFISALAVKLGISEDALKAALKAVQLDRIAAKEAAGEITAEQAAAQRQAVEDGTALLLGGRGHGGGGRGMGGIHAGAGLATFLGITEVQLRTELQAGGTLAQVAEAQGKSRDELKVFLTDAQKTKLAEAVTAGRLTQAEADAKLAEFTAGLDGKIDATGIKAGRGGRGGRGVPAPSSGTQPSTVG